MKKIIISFAVLIFATWGCTKDRMDDPVDSDHGYTKVQDTIQMIHQVTDTSNSAQGVVLFEFSDYDNNTYHAIKIGDQIWSQENLKTTHYNDGTPIPCVQATSEWAALTSGAFCHYNNDASNSDTYGLLYNNFAIATHMLAPKGWHVATCEDWNSLMDVIGTEIDGFRYSDVGLLVDSIDWRLPFNLLGKGWAYIIPVTCTNSTVFTALPNGYRDFQLSLLYSPDREFDCLGTQASWWTSDHIIIYLDRTFGIFLKDHKPSNVGSGTRLVKDVE